MNLLRIGLLISFFSLLIISCSGENKKKEVIAINKSDSLFTIVPPEVSNIYFRNMLKETTTMNGLFYEYFYNGAGVAVGDLNGDDLPDIYFISNLKSNILYLNQGNLKFQDVTTKAKMKGKYGFPTGVTMVDINADGKLDIYICKSGKFSDPNKRRNELYINKGNDSKGIPIFEEDAKKYGLDLPHFSTQASFFDYDKDGDLDMFLLNHGITMYSYESIEKSLNIESKFRGERLYRNDNGKFKDVTKEANIINNLLGFGLGLAIGDLNNDGWPDIIVGQDYSEKDHMYLNQKDGTFKEVITKATGHISNASMGNDIADFNNDGLLDFISLDMMSTNNYDIKTSMGGMDTKRFQNIVEMGLHYQYMYNTLQINNGVHDKLPRFSDIAQLAGVSSTDWSWGPLSFDMDNDGFKDLFISNGIKKDFTNYDFINYRKERQKGLLKLKEKGKQFDLVAYTRDIMEKMPERKKVNFFYKNNGDLTFSPIDLDKKDRIKTNSNGAAYADFDNDGDLDIVVNNSDDVAFIYKNNSSEKKLGNYIKIRLKGDSKNTFGIGARLVATQKDKKQILEQYLTRGFQSSVSEVLHFGLGNEKELISLNVIWADGKEQLLTNVKANQTITLYHKNANVVNNSIPVQNRLFSDITAKSKINYKHTENVFDDFEKEVLLPHKMSNFGPALAVADINGDGLDDFYVGGAKGFNGEIFIQTEQGTFSKTSNKVWKKDALYEDIGAEFFDADADGDMDLYIVSGGNEFEPNSNALQDRLYINNGKGGFVRSINALPQMLTSGSVVKPYDYDGDGDQDLFVGGRLVPGKYPFPANSYLLKNESKNGTIDFKDVTKEVIPELMEIGMITDAIWVDVSGDKKSDLVIVGEWTPIHIFQNNEDHFENISQNTQLASKTGWWFSVASADMDNDGDMDLIAGNLGNNYKYKTSDQAPFEVFSTDFDNNGTIDIVLSYYDLGKSYPLRGRSCSSQQIPSLKKKFPTYNDFGNATLKDVYGINLENSLHYNATTFSTSYIENLGDGKFKISVLPNLAQISSVNGIILEDYNNDGFKDVLIAGNLYASEIETPRNDAGYGLLLTGNGKGKFMPVPNDQSGLFLKGDVKKLKNITLKGKTKASILVAKNNDYLQLIEVKD